MKDNKNKEMEMKNSSTQSNELNDDDLDNVAGGMTMTMESGRRLSLPKNKKVIMTINEDDSFDLEVPEDGKRMTGLRL